MTENNIIEIFGSHNLNTVLENEDLVLYVEKIEKLLNIKIYDDELDDIVTISDLIKKIDSKTAIKKVKPNSKIEIKSETD